MGAIWLPGQGMVSLESTRVDRAVREYDERLYFARNATTGDYCVFIKTEHGQEPHPILGYQEMPEPETVVAKLASIDGKRLGNEITDRIRRHNELAKKERDYRASEAAGIYAEAKVSYLHDHGKTPYFQSLRPTKKTAVKGD